MRDILPRCGDPFGHLRFNDVPDYSPRPFDKGEFVGHTAFQQHANGTMTGQIGGCDESDILGNADVNQVAELGQN